MPAVESATVANPLPSTAMVANIASLPAQAAAAAAHVKSAWKAKWRPPRVFVQLGPGVDRGKLCDEVLAVMPLAELPAMPENAATLTPQPLQLLLGTCNGCTVLLAEGHYSLYDGVGVQPCVLPLAVAAELGVDAACIVDSAVTVRDDLAPGTVVVLTDYVNNLGATPLLGQIQLGAHCFADMNDAFSQALISEFINAAAIDAFTPRLATYQAELGPQAASPAEVDIARRNGIELLGNGFVLEAILAKALQLPLMALALVAAPAPMLGMSAMPAARARAHVDHAATRVVQALRRLAAVFAAPNCSLPEENSDNENH